MIVDGLTMSYPSLYWAFDNIVAQDGCTSCIGNDGSTIDLIVIFTMSFDPSGVFSLSPVLQTISGTPTTTMQTYSIDWEGINNGSCADVPVPLYSDHPVDQNLAPFVYDPCHPRIAVPAYFTTIMRELYKLPIECLYFNDDLPYRWYDPPYTLAKVPQSAPALSPTPPASSIRASPSAPEQKTRASPIITPTATAVPPADAKFDLHL